MPLLLTQKYQPNKIAELVGQLEAQKKIKDFIINFKRQRKKALLFYGPPGIGKTAIVYAAANELNLEVVELNASDFRDKQTIQKVFAPASMQQSLFAKGKIILVDEIEGISGYYDKGGILEISNIIQTTSHPLILICEDPHDRKFQTIRKYCELLEFKSLKPSEIENHLNYISTKENKKLESQTQRKIAFNSQGDLRAALIDLQIALESQNKKIDFQTRDLTESVFHALQIIFKTFSEEEANKIVRNLPIDLDELSLWMYENLDKEYNNEDLAKALASLSKADIFYQRIKNWQYWDFLPYIHYFLVESIQSSKTSPNPHFTKFSPPSILLKFWLLNQKNQKLQTQAQEIKQRMHYDSTKNIKEYLKLQEKIKARGF